MPGPSPSGDLIHRGLSSSLQELAGRSDSEIDVALGAALIAKDTYPSLDVPALLAELDQMAAPLFRLGLEEQSADDQSRILADHVYRTLGFRGNETDYYDPKNSLLSDVMDRKLGIPITLAIVYCEIARRVGVPARGVGFPGHFLVRIERPSDPRGGALTVDPFFAGRVLDEESVVRLLRRALGPEETLRPAEHLTPASAKSILVRILTNLKAIHLTRGEHARAHLALDRILLFTPNAPDVLRERGLLAARLGANESARADLARAIELDPEAADEWSLGARLAELKSKNRVLN
jgi:regulator of sirC expression with transglutaminase-like and TPR domain